LIDSWLQGSMLQLLDAESVVHSISAIW